MKKKICRMKMVLKLSALPAALCALCVVMLASDDDNAQKAGCFLAITMIGLASLIFTYIKNQKQ